MNTIAQNGRVDLLAVMERLLKNGESAEDLIRFREASVAVAELIERDKAEREAIERALYWLNDEHVKRNDFRLGAIGASSLTYARAALAKVSPP